MSGDKEVGMIGGKLFVVIFLEFLENEINWKF